jgi:hypothetical protein
MRHLQLTTLLALAFLSHGLATTALAQQPNRVTLSGGYQDMVYTIAQNDEPLPPGFTWVCPDPRRGCEFKSASYSTHGLYADVAGHLGRLVAVAGEWQWNRSSNAGLFGGDPELEFPGLDVSIHQFAAGPRLTIARGRFAPFAQVLAGVARVSASAPGIAESMSSATLRIGGGVDVMFNSRVGLRGSAGYTRLFTSDVRNNLAQFGLGIVFKG